MRIYRERYPRHCRCRPLRLYIRLLDNGPSAISTAAVSSAPIPVVRRTIGTDGGRPVAVIPMLRRSSQDQPLVARVDHGMIHPKAGPDEVRAMRATPDSTLADPEQRIADLQRQLAECKAERDKAQRNLNETKTGDEALARETAL